MPILAIHNEIEVEFTHECNWNCPYCAIRTHQLPEITDTDIDNKLSKIQCNSFVTLSGGEPGMLKKQQIVRILENLKNKKCSLYINTNGLFISRYPQYLKEFKQIIYHCSLNLDLPDYILDVDLKLDVRYMLIVNDENYFKLDKYLLEMSFGKHKKFDIVQATYEDLTNQSTLSKENKYLLISKYSKYMTNESIYRMFHEKEWNRMVFL